MTSFLPRQIPPTAMPLRVAEWGRGGNASARTLAEFATALGEYLGVPHLFLASSGRTALRLLLDTVARQPQWGGRMHVIIPGYTCPALAKVILDAGLTPTVVDIDPLTFTYLPAALSAAVNEDTLAIIVVHPFGIPVAMGPVLAAARSVGALVIEDAAQAMGARVDGRQVGTRGHVGLYSLGPGKALALGGGGVVVTSDDVLAAALAAEWSSLAKPTVVTSAWAWLRMGLFSLAFEPPLWWLAARLGAHKIGANEASWGYRLSSFAPSQAAVGLEVLPRLDEINRQRRDHARQLMAALRELPSLKIPGVSSAGTVATSKSSAAIEGAAPAGEGVIKRENTRQPIFVRLPLLANTQAQADTIFAALTAAGIGVGRMYGRTITGFFPQLVGPALPGSERVAATLLTLPTNYHLSQEVIRRVPELIRTALTAA
jgi:dTDP-4-amino-4,6-dideoxygalactose transaminase